MFLPVNSALAAYEQKRLDGAMQDKQTGRLVNEVVKAEVVRTIDQRHAKLSEQANEGYEAINKTGWFTKAFAAVAIVGTMGAGMGFGAALGGFGGGLSGLIAGVWISAIPTIINTFTAKTIGQGIGTAVAKGDRNDMYAAQKAAGEADLTIKTDNRLQERSGLRNVDRGRDDATESYNALLDLTNKKI